MNIEIRDRGIQTRLEKLAATTGSQNIEEVLIHLLDTQEEQDRWLFENRPAHVTKIQRGLEQLDRGEGIPEHQLKAHLAKLKAQAE